MRFINTFLIVFSISFLASGCTGYGKFMKSTEKYPSTVAKDIRIYSIEKPDAKYQILGYISVYSSDADNAGNDLKAKLRQKGADLGAQAIIDFKLNINVGGGGGAEGIAVRYLQ
jgi:hypothetical protein